MKKKKFAIVLIIIAFILIIIGGSLILFYPKTKKEQDIKTYPYEYTSSIIKKDHCGDDFCLTNLTVYSTNTMDATIQVDIYNEQQTINSGQYMLIFLDKNKEPLEGRYLSINEPIKKGKNKTIKIKTLGVYNLNFTDYKILKLET